MATISDIMDSLASILIYERRGMKVNLYDNVKCKPCKGKGHLKKGSSFGYDYVMVCDKCSGKGKYEQIKPISMKNLQKLLNKQENHNE